MNQEEIARSQMKTPEQRFKQMLWQEFGFAPKVAELLLQEAQTHLLGQPGELRPGQMRVVLTAYEASHGQTLAETPQREIIWTVDAGAEDRQVMQAAGAVGLRRHRLRRLLSEALEQGLQVSSRTIKRDFAALQAAGEWLPSRGKLFGIGRGQTHKAQILRRWLQGETYDQLVLRTRHSLVSIRRYVQTFVRVLQLHQQGFEDSQIALLVQIGLPLVQEYLAVWQENDTPACRERLAEQLQRLQQSPEGQKKSFK
jgi:hypothetical protein